MFLPISQFHVVRGTDGKIIKQTQPWVLVAAVFFAIVISGITFDAKAGDANANTVEASTIVAPTCMGLREKSNTEMMTEAREKSAEIDDELSRAKKHGDSDAVIKKLVERSEEEKLYIKSLISLESITDKKCDVISQNFKFISFTGDIPDLNVVNSVHKSVKYRRLMNTEGKKLGDLPSIQKGIVWAARDIGIRLIPVDDEDGKNAVILFRAAYFTARNPNASADDRYDALQFLSDAVDIMKSGE